MDSIRFVIAKKMEKPPAKEAGIRLGSFKADAAGGVLSLMSPDSALLKESAAAFRSMTGLPLYFRVRGKSVQIASEVSAAGSEALADEEPAEEGNSAQGGERAAAPGAGIAAIGGEDPRASESADGPAAEDAKAAEGAFGILIEFAKGLSFQAEDVADVFEFCGLPAAYPFGTLKLLSIDMDRSRTEIGAELVLHAGEGGEADPEEIYSQLLPVLTKYDMGIIKQDRL